MHGLIYYNIKLCKRYEIVFKSFTYLLCNADSEMDLMICDLKLTPSIEAELCEIVTKIESLRSLFHIVQERITDVQNEITVLQNKEMASTEKLSDCMNQLQIISKERLELLVALGNRRDEVKPYIDLICDQIPITVLHPPWYDSYNYINNDNFNNFF